MADWLGALLALIHLASVGHLVPRLNGRQVRASFAVGFTAHAAALWPTCSHCDMLYQFLSEGLITNAPMSPRLKLPTLIKACLSDWKPVIQPM